MKTFKQFLSESTHEKGTYENPHKISDSDHEPFEHHKKQFAHHAKDIEKNHLSVARTMMSYKGPEEHEHINDLLRNKPHFEVSPYTHHQIKNLDHATSHKTTHDMHVYRGIPNEDMKFHKLKPGKEFSDHAYTSTTLNHKTAREKFAGSYSDPNAKRHVMKIHVPKGTKAHHFDAHSNVSDNEHEVVLHRGTRFHVTHHSHDPEHNTHYVHVKVVGQKPRKVKFHHDPNYVHDDTE